MHVSAKRLVQRTGRAPLLAFLIGVLLAGCAPPCDQVCRKARKCDLSPRLSQDECVEACDRQRAFYDIEEDKDGKEAFAAERRCVMQATCEEIHAGECYDEEVFPF